jgi:uncharacterized protein
MRLAMSHRIESNSGQRRVEYRWRRGGVTSAVVGEGLGAPAAPVPDSEEAFMTRRHWGYTTQRDGATVEYHVAHPVWNVSPVERGAVVGDATGVFGPQFAEVVAHSPRSAFFADGSAIAVHDPVRLA